MPTSSSTEAGFMSAGVLEVAALRIVQGQEAAFEAAFEKARLCLDGAQGYLSHALHRQLGEPHQYLLIIQWQSLEDHTLVFRSSPPHDEWRRLLSPFYEGRPLVSHYARLA